MAKMTAIQAAVWVMEKEGVTQVFGIPGAAINPLYAALRKQGTIAHILARHVEGALVVQLHGASYSDAHDSQARVGVAAPQCRARADAQHADRCNAAHGRHPCARCGSTLPV